MVFPWSVPTSDQPPTHTPQLPGDGEGVDGNEKKGEQAAIVAVEEEEEEQEEEMDGRLQWTYDIKYTRGPPKNKVGVGSQGVRYELEILDVDTSKTFRLHIPLGGQHRFSKAIALPQVENKVLRNQLRMCFK